MCCDCEASAFVRERSDSIHDSSMDEGERKATARCVTAFAFRPPGGRKGVCDARHEAWQRRKLAHSLLACVRPRPLYPLFSNVISLMFTFYRSALFQCSGVAWVLCAGVVIVPACFAVRQACSLQRMQFIYRRFQFLQSGLFICFCGRCSSMPCKFLYYPDVVVFFK